MLFINVHQYNNVEEMFNCKLLFAYYSFPPQDTIDNLQI